MARYANTQPLFLDADASKLLGSQVVRVMTPYLSSHHLAWWTNRRTDESESQERSPAVRVHMVSQAPLTTQLLVHDVMVM